MEINRAECEPIVIDETEPIVIIDSEDEEQQPNRDIVEPTIIDDSEDEEQLRNINDMDPIRSDSDIFTRNKQNCCRAVHHKSECILQGKFQKTWRR